MKLWLVTGIVGCAALASAQEHPPMVPPAGPGVFTVKPSGPDTFRLVVTGHAFTSRGDIEKYLAYRAARLTIEQGGQWFTLNEDRGKGETAEPAVRDPEGPRYSFRMKYFRPVWRYKTSGSPEWARWSPFAGAPFISADPKTISDFEVSVDIVVHKGPMDDADPLAFEAWALSDLLVNQVSPPK
ncbi:MAG TPA: hypothetical protein VGF59_21890 [Bryobacteraceae bacterium]|jgi:hypothetical protein